MNMKIHIFILDFILLFSSCIGDDALEEELHMMINPTPRVTYVGKHFITVGEEMTISCTLSTREMIRWTHNGNDIIPGEGGYNLVIGENETGYYTGKLSVMRTKNHHAGVYKCLDNSARAHSVYVLNDDTSSSPPVRLYVGYKLRIGCNITESLNPTLAVDWYKDGELIPEDDDESQYEISHLNSTLLIKDAQEEHVGTYTCKSKMDPIKAKNISVVILNYKSLPKSTTVTEGEKVFITCNADGSPPPKISWLRDDNPLSDYFNKWQVSFAPNKKGIENGTMIIDKADMSMRGNYMCIIDFSVYAQPLTSTTFLRIKSVYAALWPFLGIVIEVVILTTIILVYEKKKRDSCDDADMDITSSIMNTMDHTRRSQRRRQL